MAAFWPRFAKTRARATDAVPEALSEAVERALGHRPARVSDLGGGHGARVFRLTFDDRPPVVAKTSARDDGALSTEAFMLRYLAKMSRLPVPEVLHDDPIS